MAISYSIPAGCEHVWTTWIVECMTCSDPRHRSALKLADIYQRLTREQATALAKQHGATHDLRLVGLNIDWGVLEWGLT